MLKRLWTILVYLAQYRGIKRSLKVVIDKVRHSREVFLALKSLNLKEVAMKKFKRTLCCLFHLS